MASRSILSNVLFRVVIPAAITLACHAYFFLSYHNENIDSAYDKQNISAVNRLSEFSSILINEDKRDLLKAVAKPVINEPYVDSLLILDADYKVLAHLGANVRSIISPDTFSNTETMVIQNIDHVTYIKPLLLAIEGNQNSLVGWALLETNILAIEQNKSDIFELVLISHVILLLISACVALYVAHNMKKPVGSMTEAVERLSKGDLDVRLDKTLMLEYDKLAIGINLIADNLSRTREEMAREIDQTTDDLRETLETIEIQNVELDIARREAVAANKIKSEFLANMSHEIRTPLNGIIGFTNLLFRSHLSQQQYDHLTIIRQSSEILLTIINDILDFSKVESGKLVFDRTPIELREVTDDVISMLAPTAHAKNLNLVHIFYRDVPHCIMGDPLRLKQVVTNLVNNGIKFTQTGEVVVRVMLEDTENGNEAIKFSIQDTGVGLSRAQQHSIFNAFSQADATTARRFGGTGLGLAISKKLIEEMGGDIGFNSELGKGSEFWFTLPTTMVISEPDKDSLPSLNSLSIICLETHHLSRLSMEHFFEEWEAEAVFAKDVNDLIAKTQARHDSDNPFDIAIICADRKEISAEDYRDEIALFETFDCATLLVTPTLDRYDQPILQKVSSYTTKPLTRRRLHRILLELASTKTEANDDSYSLKPIYADFDGSGNSKILVVDDNTANLLLVKTLLEEMNIACVLANDGFEAIKHCKNEVFPLILMDIQMPGMDGLEAMQHIRNINETYKNSLIVALTAYALPEEKSLLLDSGFDGFLTKPLSESQLRVIVEKALLPADETENENTEQIEAEEFRDKILLPSDSTTTIDLERDQDLPTVDYLEGIKLSNGKVDLAIDMFARLAESLPKDKKTINDTFEANELDDLESIVHKLHGATHYCGVPALRKQTLLTESALKRKEDVSTRIKELNKQIDAVILWSESEDWKNAFDEATKQTGTS